MFDVVDIISQKRISLQKQRQNAEEAHKQIIADLDRQLDEIDITLAKINGYMEPYVCPKCKGTGVVKVCDAAGDTEEMPCHTCRGMGLRMSEEE